MKTEYRLARALKELMSDKRKLDEISVTALTKKCKVNRQTFYYHFHDIYDLLTLVFLQEEIPGVKYCRTHVELLTRIYEYYDKNSAFLDSVLESAGKDLFVEFINNSCYKTFDKLLTGLNEDKQITKAEEKVIARFAAAGFSYNITFYFQNIKNKSLEGLLANFNMLGDDFLKNAIVNMKKSRKKK